MTELSRERAGFVEHLHEIFLMKKGYGAFAYVSISDVMRLFDRFLDSDESADLLINRYVNSI